MERVLLIGYGSIGKFHLTKLRDRYAYISIVEPDQNKHVEIFESFSKVNFFKSIQQVEYLSEHKFAVIANWGPDHFDTVNKLVTYGIKKFLIEKPLCDSLKDLKSFKKLVDRKEIEIVSHFQWSYSHLPSIIEKFSSKISLGLPISIVVNGGAKCLATNGIHFLALANIVFKGCPIRDSMLVKNDYINPRNSKFLFLEGNATWQYSQSRYLSINFFNKSHNALSFIINFQYGIGIVYENNLKIYEITSSDRNKIEKPTRTKQPSKLIYDGDAFIFPDMTDGTDKIYEILQNGVSIFDQLHSIEVTESFLAALKNSERNNRIFKRHPLFFVKKNRRWAIS